MQSIGLKGVAVTHLARGAMLQKGRLWGPPMHESVCCTRRQCAESCGVLCVHTEAMC